MGISWAAGFGNVLHELRHLDPIWLPVAFGMELAAYFGYVVAYREVARLEGGPRLGLGRAGAIVAAGFGAFVIRGGFVVDRQALEAAGLDPRQARARVLGLGALEYAVLAPAAALAAVILLARGSTHPSLGFTLPWAIAVPLGFSAAFAALAFRHRVGEEGRWRSVLQHALDAVHMLKKLAAQSAEYGGAFVGTTLYWVGDVGCLWASLRVFHDSPDVAALVIGTPRDTRSRGARFRSAERARSGARVFRPRLDRHSTSQGSTCRLCLPDLQPVAAAAAGRDRPAASEALA